MYNFYAKVLMYLFCFAVSLFGLNAIDLNRFIKQGKVGSAQILYLILACCLGYLLANFFMSIIYFYN